MDRRTALLALLPLALLTACGRGAEDTAAVEDTAAEARTRTVVDARGPVEVPADPRRVVVLDGYAVDALGAVGVTPVGAPVPDLGGYLELPDGVADVGPADPVDVEAVAALDPDLVLVASEQTDVDLRALGQLAPVVVAPHDDSGDWREASLVYADAVGERGAMEAVLAQLDERTAAMSERISAARVGPVTVARADPDQLRLYGRAYFSGTILEALGVPRPADQDVVEDGPIRISYEQVGSADADTVFLYRLSGEDAASQREALAANPLWQRLRAVGAGRVFEVDDHWYGSGPQAARLVLDDVERALLG